MPPVVPALAVHSPGGEMDEGSRGRRRRERESKYADREVREGSQSSKKLKSLLEVDVLARDRVLLSN